MFSVTNFSVFRDEKQIIHDINLSGIPGSLHVILGKNGSGKSTFALALAGHPSYRSSGTALFHGTDVCSLPAHERSRAGLFVLFQHLSEIPGVRISSFLYEIARAHQICTGSPAEFNALLRPLLPLVRFDESILDRDLHRGFSGGEKKRLELLQMLLLRPKIVILDEPDSGLDVNAVSIVSDCIAWLQRVQPETIIILITHYAQLFMQHQVSAVHLFDSGRLIRSGNSDLAHQIFTKGYDHVLSAR